jgi:hypothetical protein
MSKTTVLYKDIAVGADEDATVSSTNTAEFSQIDNLPFGFEHNPVATFEPNSWVLNGSRSFVDTQNLSLWSKELSGYDGVFTKKPVITVEFDEQYSSLGITLVFDQTTGEYCASVNIKWYQGGTIKSNVDFTPNNDVYFCKNKVEAFDKIVITLNATILPFRYAKLDKIIFGLLREFGMSELRSAKITNQTDLLVDTLPVSQFSWTLDSKDDIGFMFQLKQPVEVKNDQNLIGVYYVDKHSRTANNIYKIDCHDAFGVLGENQFSGGVYVNGVSARSLLSQIVGDDFDIEYLAEDKMLYGILEPSTRREAAQQVLFACGVIATTDGQSGIRVFSLPEEVTDIGEDKTYSGSSVNTSSIVTKVVVVSHSYTQDANGSITINGINYKDTESKYEITNPDVTASDKANIKEISGATLVSSHNVQEVAQRFYNHCMKRNTNNSKIVWSGERLCDCVSLPTSWKTRHTGNITKMSITLSNTVAADVETIGY